MVDNVSTAFHNTLVRSAPSSRIQPASDAYEAASASIIPVRSTWIYRTSYASPVSSKWYNAGGLNQAEVRQG